MKKAVYVIIWKAVKGKEPEPKLVEGMIEQLGGLWIGYHKNDETGTWAATELTTGLAIVRGGERGCRNNRAALQKWLTENIDWIKSALERCEKHNGKYRKQVLAFYENARVRIPFETEDAE